MPNKNKKRWIAGVKTVSTYPPPGLFTKSATTIARTLGSKEVSPKGPVSGLRMLTLLHQSRGEADSAASAGRSWKKPRHCCRNGSSAKSRHAKRPPDAALLR
jgi:hypothetical protein